ncbi:MAG: hypothetical protein IJ632_05830 [Muribaculaceae bacterium]|nr:hypothetical protein [Muribaculaceae bacterium]
MSDIKTMLNRAQGNNDPWAANQHKAAEQKQAAKKPVKKKKKKTGKSAGWQPHSAWGCAWRSAVFTLALFTVYFIFGWLLSW